MSITQVVPPTSANFTSSRCLIAIRRRGSGIQPSTRSTTATRSIVPDGRPDPGPGGARARRRLRHRGRRPDRSGPPARRRHGRRRPARPDDPSGRDRAGPVAARARRRRRTTRPRCVCADVVPGAPDDLAALRALADGARRGDLRPRGRARSTLLRALVAEGVAVHPGPDALVHAQDKLVMRRALAGLAGMPRLRRGRRPRGRRRRSPPRTGWPRGAQGGPRRATTGAGVWLLDGPDPDLVAAAARRRDAADGRAGGGDAPRAGGAGRALALRAGRGVAGGGDGAARRAVRRGARARRRTWTRRPPRPPSSSRCASPSELGVTGLLAVELFDTDGTAGGLVVNELAMRPHNSGHWTIEGSRTSQFEQHLRAVLDYPLGATEPTAPVVVMANVLGARRTARDVGRRAAAPRAGPVPGRQGAPLRQGRAAGPQGRARDGARVAARRRPARGRCSRRSGCRRACGPTGGRRTTPTRARRGTRVRAVASGA